MILAKKLVMSNFLKASFFEKLMSRAELFEPKTEPSRAKNEPSLGSGATLVPSHFRMGHYSKSTGALAPVAPIPGMHIKIFYFESTLSRFKL